MKFTLKRNICLLVCVLSLVSFSISAFASTNEPVLTVDYTGADMHYWRIYTYPTSYGLDSNSDFILFDKAYNEYLEIPAGNQLVINCNFETEVSCRFTIYKIGLGRIASKLITTPTKYPQYVLNPYSDDAKYYITITPYGEANLKSYEFAVYKN